MHKAVTKVSFQQVKVQSVPRSPAIYCSCDNIYIIRYYIIYFVCLI